MSLSESVIKSEDNTVPKADNLNDIKNNNEEDEDTLKDDLEKTEVNSQVTDVSHTTELFVDEENIVISSPVDTPCSLDQDIARQSAKFNSFLRCSKFSKFSFFKAHPYTDHFKSKHPGYIISM